MLLTNNNINFENITHKNLIGTFLYYLYEYLVVRLFDTEIYSSEANACSLHTWCCKNY